MCRDGAASVPGPAQAYGVEGVVSGFDRAQAAYDSDTPAYLDDGCDHDWMTVEFTYAGWVECEHCGFRPTEDEFEAWMEERGK